jgi:DNA-binding SARP family transcriptional activator
VASVEGTNGGVPTHTVGAGDSMWSVAEDQLTRAWGRQPATDEVSAYWQSLLALNETQLASSGDPNRIYAGQQILLAAVPADPEGASPSPVPTVTEPPVPLPETPPPAPSTTQPTAPPTSTTARPADNTPVPAERSVERAPQAGEEALPARLLAEIAGLTLLATGLLVRLRLLRRRQRAAQGVQSSGSGSVPAPLEQGLAATADLPLSRWAGQELARLAQRLDPHRLGAGAPVAVELSEDSGIEMLWNQRMPDPPSPWKAIDEGWAWKLAYDPEAAVPPDELPAPVPALVTVGERDRRQLLIDLEAYGSIALAGDAERVTEFATALALELGASEELANAYVYTVGYESPGTAQLDRVTAVDEDDATRRLSSRRTEVDEALTSMNVSSAFAMRCGPDAPGLETVVVFSRATDPQVNGEFIVHSPSGHGVAAVIFGSAPAESGARITLGADGTARFDPLGIVFRPAGMPVALAERVNVLLAQEPTSDGPDHDSRLGTGERAERVVDPVEPEPPQPFVAENTDPLVEELAPADEEPSQASQTRFFDPGRLHVAARDGKQVDSDDRLVVRVLGPPRIPDRPGLGRRELELIVLIACKEKPVHPSTVLNAIWGGKQVQGKTLWNLMARARKALGTFDDGEEILPPADRVRNSLRLSDRVVTDLALLRDLYEQALHESSTTAIALLRQGLNLVEGEPFDTPGYNWAHHQDQYVHEAAALIEDAATQLVELATTAGDTATARDAILRGLRGLPGNEALYRARMELEHATGNTAAVHAAWDELVEFLFDLDSEPSEATRTVYERLTGGHAGDLNS